MNYILDITIIIVLLAIAYQDFRLRAFSWILVPILLTLFTINCIHIQGADLIFKPILTNIVTLGFIMVGTVGVISLRRLKLINPLDNLIGIGDILLFLLLCTFFSPVNYIVFIVSSLVLITLVWGIYLLVVRDWAITIPLAGALAVLLVLLIGAKWLFRFNYYDDELSLAIIQPIIWR